jgi:hypothetical protein
MAVTREDLTSYKAEKQNELAAVSEKEAEELKSIEEKVEAFRNELVGELTRVTDLERATLNAEIRLLDTLIERADKKEEELV